MDFARARDEESAKKTVVGGKEMNVESTGEKSEGREQSGRNDWGGRRMRGSEVEKVHAGVDPRMDIAGQAME